MRLWQGLAFTLLAGSSAVAISVTTARQDNQRTAANTGETRLTPANVVAGFGKLATLAVDGAVYAQPLYVPNLTIGGAQHDTVFVATMHESIYAFDAHSGTQLWKTTFGTAMSTWPSKGIQDLIYGNEIGCLSTPVIDETNSLLYAVCAGSGTGSSASWLLYKLNLLTGAVIGSGVTITGSVSPATFDPQFELQRIALTLESGKVYIGFGSYSDLGVYQGWIFSYDATAMTQSAIFCVARTGSAGIWQSSAGMATDASGNLYVMTGNGTWDGTSNFGVSFIKLSPSLTLLDWFTPSNHATLNSEDWDLSSGVAIVDLNSSQVFGGSKDGRVWNLVRTDMGHLQGGGGTAPQVFLTKAATSGQVHTGIYGGMFMNNVLYQPWVGDKIYAFSLSGSTFNTTPVTSASTFAYPGVVMTGSSNGATNQIIWATVAASNSLVTPVAGTLRAFDSTLTQIYSSGARTHDTLGTFTKFAPPTVADGLVIVATQDNAVKVFGLLPSSGLRGQATIRGQAVLR